jgi:hypothetical protein
MPLEDQPYPLPILLTPDPEIENSARMGALVMVWGVGLCLLVAVPLWWGASERSASAGGAFVILCLAAMLVAGLVVYRRLSSDSERFIILTHDSLWLGSQEIEWSRITAPVIEEIEQETGPADCRVAFCVIGEQTFGAWRYLNPRLYTYRVSAKTAAEVLCNCLNEARRRALAPASDTSEAEMPVSPLLRIAIDAAVMPGSIRESSPD